VLAEFDCAFTSQQCHNYNLLSTNKKAPARSRGFSFSASGLTYVVCVNPIEFGVPDPTTGALGVIVSVIWVAVPGATGVNWLLE
jgi:hypothetical protein